MVKFEWDSNKAKLNLKKHSVSFEEASQYFRVTKFECSLMAPIQQSWKSDLLPLVIVCMIEF